MVQHCDDDVLALIAMGETVDAVDDAHVQQCPRCQSRLDQLAAVVTTTRSITPQDSPVAPPPAVWDAIATELALDSARTNVVSLDSRRRRRPWLMAAAAVAGIALGSAVTFGLLQSGSQGELIAQATLAPVQDSEIQSQQQNYEQVKAGPQPYRVHVFHILARLSRLRLSHPRTLMVYFLLAIRTDSVTEIGLRMFHKKFFNRTPFIFRIFDAFAV